MQPADIPPHTSGVVMLDSRRKRSLLSSNELPMGEINVATPNNACCVPHRVLNEKV